MNTKLHPICPRLSKAGDDRWRLVILGLAGLYDGLVMVLSLGYLVTDVRAWLLFDKFDDDDN